MKNKISPSFVDCPACGKKISFDRINYHLDSNCTDKANLKESTIGIKRNLSFDPSTETKKLKKTNIENNENSNSSNNKTGEEEKIFISDDDSSNENGNHKNLFNLKNIKNKSSDGNSIFKLGGSKNLSNNIDGKNDTNSNNKKSLNSNLNTTVNSNSNIKTNFHLSTNLKSNDRKNNNYKSGIPLAELARPRTLDEFVGQKELVGKNGILRGFINNDIIPSMILWGPSGVGKTTLSRIIAASTKSKFIELSATNATVQDVKRVFEEARNEKRLLKRKTILFLDEVHRFSRSQQDVLLPAIEKGEIILIGATTENPSFKMNSALLSRCKVFVMHKLELSDIEHLIKQAITKFIDLGEYDLKSNTIKNDDTSDENIKKYQSHPLIDDEIIKYLSRLSDGDGRVALNSLELVMGMITTSSSKITVEEVRNAISKTSYVYDRSGDMHYDSISALHKSVRGSDADAALYYLGRMLIGGEDPLYVARRLIRMASEDIGVADETCLPFAVATYQACERLGMPECDCILAHCVVKLANAKKSVLIYRAYGRVKQLLSTGNISFGPDIELANNIDNTKMGHNKSELYSNAPIPIHLRNAPTKLMKELGYGKEYKYNPDYVDGKVDQEYMPQGLEGIKFLGSHHLGDNKD